MKKEIVSVMMAACLFASLATGCGTANESETSSKSGSEAASVTSASEEAAGAVSKSGETTTDGHDPAIPVIRNVQTFCTKETGRDTG